MKAALSKAIDAALNDTSSSSRYNAIRLIDRLTVVLSNSHETGMIIVRQLYTASDNLDVAESATFFKNEVVILSIPNILKVVFPGTGGPSPPELRGYATSLVLSYISRPNAYGMRFESSTLRDTT